MNAPFSVVMRKLFRDLDHEFLEIEAELQTLKSAEKNLKDKRYPGFEKLKEWIGILYRTSVNQSLTFKRMSASIVLAKEFAVRAKQDPAQKNAQDWDKILETLELVRKSIGNTAKRGLVYVERLPLSLDGGWKGKGEISPLRKFLNIPGYILAAPYLALKEFLGEMELNAKRTGQKAYLSRSLADVKETIESLQSKPYRGSSERERQWLKEGYKDQRAAMKNLKIYLRMASKLQRQFRNLGEKCNKMYNIWTYVVIDEDKVLAITQL